MKTGEKIAGVIVVAAVVFFMLATGYQQGVRASRDAVARAELKMKEYDEQWADLQQAYRELEHNCGITITNSTIQGDQNEAKPQK